MPTDSLERAPSKMVPLRLDVRGNDAGRGRADERLLEGRGASANGSLGRRVGNNTFLSRFDSVGGRNPATFFTTFANRPPPPNLNIDDDNAHTSCSSWLVLQDFRLFNISLPNTCATSILTWGGGVVEKAYL